MERFLWPIVTLICIAVIVKHCDNRNMWVIIEKAGVVSKCFRDHNNTYKDKLKAYSVTQDQERILANQTHTTKCILVIEKIDSLAGICYSDDMPDELYFHTLLKDCQKNYNNLHK